MTDKHKIAQTINDYLKTKQTQTEYHLYHETPIIHIPPDIYIEFNDNNILTRFKSKHAAILLDYHNPEMLNTLDRILDPTFKLQTPISTILLDTITTEINHPQEKPTPTRTNPNQNNNPHHTKQHNRHTNLQHQSNNQNNRQEKPTKTPTLTHNRHNQPTPNNTRHRNNPNLHQPPNRKKTKQKMTIQETILTYIQKELHHKTTKITNTNHFIHTKAGQIELYFPPQENHIILYKGFHITNPTNNNAYYYLDTTQPKTTIEYSDPELFTKINKTLTIKTNKSLPIILIILALTLILQQLTK